MHKFDRFFLITLLFLIPLGLSYGLLSNEPMINLLAEGQTKLLEAGCISTDNTFLTSQECDAIYAPYLTQVGQYSTLSIISAPFAIIGYILSIILLIWMIIDVFKRKTLNIVKKVGWVVLFFVVGIAIPWYFVGVKRKDWDPENKNRKRMIIVTVIAFVLFLVAALFGLFFGVLF